MNKKRVFIGIVIIFVFLFVLKNAESTFVYHNNSIKTSYSAGEILQGKINMSFINEPAKSIFSSNFLGEISLISLIKNSSFVNEMSYNCTTIGCNEDYSASREISNSINLGSNEKKTIGINISGEDASLQALRIGINSNAEASCYGQAGIDVLDNESYAFRNNKYLPEKCGVKYQGCFSEGNEIAELTGNVNRPYCEKITLPSAPAYSLSAKIYNSTKNYAELNAEIYTLDWTLLGSCVFPKHSQHFEELNCTAEVSTQKQQDYLVCVSAKSDSNYTIPSEQSSPICGTAERGSNEYSRDYFIFAEALKYDIFNIELNETNFNKLTEKSMISTINAYIEDKYGNNCKNGCAIPLTLISSIGQSIGFQNIEIKYNTKGTLITSSKIFELQKREPSISSGPIILELEDAKMKIPKNSQEKNIILKLGASRITSIPISLTTSFDFDITPKSLTIGFPTLFKIISSENISSASWKFGDGSIGTSQGKNISHIYKEQKTFEIEVSATRLKDTIVSTKKFNVVVANANESVKKLINLSEDKISGIKQSISKYPEWIRNKLEEKSNILELSKSLDEIKNEYKTSKNESEYVEIIEKILELAVPDSMSVSSSGKESLIEGLSTAEIEYLEEISKKKTDDKENTRKEIVTWIEDNYETNMEREVISVFSDKGSNSLITKFNIKLNKKNDSKSVSYLIINLPKEQITFERDYKEKEVELEGNKATYIKIEGNNEINFIISEEIVLSSVGAYFAPDIGELQGKVNVDEHVIGEGREKASRYWLIVLVICFLISYIALQEWYKRRYESYLFKNRDDLYNIINFLYNARASGIQDDEIKNKLGQSGWKGEQINYAFKKIEGKRTGMWEIPIFKFIENRKVKQELEKRQQLPLDARFIKRQNLF